MGHRTVFVEETVGTLHFSCIQDSSFLQAAWFFQNSPSSCSCGSMNRTSRFTQHPEHRQERDSELGPPLVAPYATVNTLAVWLHQERFSPFQFDHYSQAGDWPFPSAVGWFWYYKCSFSSHKTRRR